MLYAEKKGIISVTLRYAFLLSLVYLLFGYSGIGEVVTPPSDRAAFPVYDVFGGDTIGIRVMADDLDEKRAFYALSYNVSPDGDITTTGNISAGTAGLIALSEAFVATCKVNMGIRVTGSGLAGVDLVTTIAAMASATSLTLADNASATVSGTNVYHDEDAGLQAAIDAASKSGGGVVELPMGTFRLVSDVDLKSKVSLRGQGNSTIISAPIGNWPISAVGSVTGIDSMIHGVVIEDCEDAWNVGSAGITASADSDDKQVGSASAKFAEDGISDAGDLLAYEIISSTDLSPYAELEFWIKCGVSAGAGDFQILLDDTMACTSPVESIDMPVLTADTWTHVTVDIANPQSFKAIVSVGIKMVVDKGAFSLWIDDIEAVGCAGKQEEITVTDASSFTVGDYIRIYSDELFDGGPERGGTRKGEIQKILAISSNTLTLENCVADTYKTAYSATVEKLIMYEDITVADIKFVGGGESLNQRGIHFVYCSNLRLLNLTLVDFYNRSIQVTSSIDTIIDGCVIRNSNKAGNGYGIKFRNESRNFTVNNCHFSECRHAFDCGGDETYGVQRFGVVSNCTVEGGSNQIGAFSPHHTCEHITFANNIVHGTHLGSPNAPYLTFIGNRCLQSDDSQNGLAIWKGAHDLDIIGNYFELGGTSSAAGVRTSGANSEALRLNIRGNTFKKTAPSGITTYGILFDHEVIDCQIIDNTFDGMDYGIAIAPSAGNAACSDIQIQGNKFRDLGAEAVRVNAIGQDINRISILNNYIDGNSRNVAIKVLDDNSGSNIVTGILIDGNFIQGAWQGISIENYTTDWRIGSGNVFTDTRAHPVKVDGANIGEGSVGVIARATESLDLSGAATDSEVFIAPDACQLVMYDIIYAEAASGDAGTTIRVGRYQDGVAHDDDYFDSIISDNNAGAGRNKGFKTRILTGSLTQYALSAGDIVTVGTAGGKTGTGKVMLVLYFVLSAQ